MEARNQSLRTGSGITRRFFLVGSAASVAVLTVKSSLAASVDENLHHPTDIESEFAVPPMTAKPWVYWWWLEGVATKAGITADLEEMKRQGISGVLVFNAGGGGPGAPKGAKFMSDEWRENFRHAVGEADRLGMDVGISLCSG